MTNLREQTEEQVLTFSNLSTLFRTHNLTNDKLLMDLHFDLRDMILRTTTCIDVMFRLTSKDTPVFRMYSYEQFEKDLNRSSQGFAICTAYYKVWEMYESFFRSTLEPIYDEVLAKAQQLTRECGLDPHNPADVEDCIILHGYKDLESCVIAEFSKQRPVQA